MLHIIVSVALVESSAAFIDETLMIYSCSSAHISETKIPNSKTLTLNKMIMTEKHNFSI